MTKAKSIPVANRSVYEAVIGFTDAVCQQYLNEEWGELCRELSAALARKRPSPLLRGQSNVWAAGILHALGMVNFLFDRSQTPSMSLDELCTAFDVKSSTVGSKSRAIRELLKMRQFDPHWTLYSKLEQNPLIWMINVNGLLMDVRQTPLEIQIQAYQKGIIPYIPGLQLKDEE
ncbi:MAG: DUF6398 domain-containing protein [Candidatus Desantisbacteria bacterium]